MENVGPDGDLVGVAESSVASAATCDIGAANTSRVAITGTTTITSLGAAANRLRFLRFAGALTLTHNAASLILPGGASIVTAAGDTAIAMSDASGNWRLVVYVRADGRPVSGYVTVLFVIDGGGAAIATGIKGDLGPFDFAGVIEAWTILADQAGSIVIDIWKDAYANFPPVVADSITASAKPTLTAATKAQSSTLTGWSTAIAAGDTLRFNVDSAATVQRVTIALKVRRT